MCFRGSLRSLAVSAGRPSISLTLIQNRIFPTEPTKPEGDRTTEICAASREWRVSSRASSPCLEIHNAMRLVSAVCYHAARPGHTIDPKRVVDATVPMADVMVCWTCQTFTDIARGERGGRKEMSGLSGWRASLPQPGQVLSQSLIIYGTGLPCFLGVCCSHSIRSGIVLVWTVHGIGDAAWEACFKFICWLGSKRLVAADSLDRGRIDVGA